MPTDYTSKLPSFIACSREKTSNRQFVFIPDLSVFKQKGLDSLKTARESMSGYHESGSFTVDPFPVFQES